MRVSTVLVVAAGAAFVAQPGCANAAGGGGGGFGDDGGANSTSSGSGGSGSAAGSGGSSGLGSSSGSTPNSSSGSGSSSSGSGSGVVSSPPVGGSSSGSSSSGGGNGGACSATVAMGAVPLVSNYLSANVIGKGGYAYSYSDMKGSTACSDMTALCAAGSTAVADAAGTIWGAGVGLSLNQMMAMSSTSPPVNTDAATGSGISYALSNLPTQGMRLIIDNSGTDYCSPLTAASGTIKWASFNSKCWDMSGMNLSGPPTAATHVQFQVTAATMTASFDFCVTSVSFAP